MGLAVHSVPLRRFGQVVLMVLLTGVLASCTERNTAMRAAAHPSAMIQPVYVATTRPLDRTGPAFGQPRLTRLNYFRVDVSVPPTHEAGRIEWARGTPDARTDFVVTDTEVYRDRATMVRAAQRASAVPETLLFVHGYNNTLSEAMYRLAQIQADFDPGEPAVLFSWPSAGDARGYIYDRDSVLFARDDLHSVLQSLTSARGEKVFLVAHSMGSHLLMEVLRQAALTGDRRVLDRISGVVLIAPDIDPELFRRQAEAIGKLPQPFLIFASKQDRALGFSALLSGRKPRLGVVDGPDKVDGLDVAVLDFSELSERQGLNHMVPVTSPTAIGLLKGLIEQGEDAATVFGRYLVLRRPVQ